MGKEGPYMKKAALIIKVLSGKGRLKNSELDLLEDLRIESRRGD